MRKREMRKMRKREMRKKEIRKRERQMEGKREGLWEMRKRERERELGRLVQKIPVLVYREK